MTQTIPLAQVQVRQLVDDWYRGLDEHAPTEQLLSMLADSGLEMRMPEITLRGADDFRSWYENTIINRFFDEVHELVSLDITIDGERADVRLVTHWQARQWNPPAPRSERIDYNATQSWVVGCSARDARPVIVTYSVDEFVPNAGSVVL